MKKISFILSLLFIFGQVVTPRLTVGAVSFNNNSNTTKITEKNSENQSTIEVNADKEIKTSQIKNQELINQPIVDEVESNINNEKSDDVKVDELYEKVKKYRPSTYSLEDTKDIHYEREEYANDMNAMEEIEYLVNKTNSNFEVVLSIGDGVYSYVDSANTIEEAIEKSKLINLMEKSIQDAIPTIIDSNGVIVYSSNAMGRVLKHINGEPYYASDINTDLYPNADKSGFSNYINPGYVDDVPVIEDRGDVAKIQVSGYTGWINKNTSLKEYDMIIVPLNNVKNPSYFETINGELNHWISYDMTTANKGNNKIIGVAPEFMKPGIKYYSYDNNFFYTDLNTLISDLKQGNRINAVNSNEAYYSYYSYLPFRSKTSYSAEDLDRFINKNTDEGNKLRGIGQNLINVQNTYGVNAATILGIAINESGWGKSDLAKKKNNIFGLEAYDANPEDAKAFKSVEQCINEFANFWISKGYADPQDARFYGGFLGSKVLGLNVKYASDPFWGEKAASFAYAADKDLSGNNLSSLVDYNSNILGMLVSESTVKLANRSFLYEVTSNIRENATFVGVPVLLNSSAKYVLNGSECYSINPDRTTALPLAGGVEFGGVYDWSIKGYINAGAVKVINPSSEYGVVYQTHVQTVGWQDKVANGMLAGTVGRSLAVESIRIKFDNMPFGASIKYRAHVKNIGWQDWVADGALAGTTGRGLQVEAIQMQASGLDPNKELQYRVHVQDEGWQEWQTNGDIAGTTGKSRRIEAIEIRIIDSLKIDIGYETHIKDIGWLPSVNNGQMSGTIGQHKRVEAIKIGVSSNMPNIGVKYRTHVQDIGWQEWVSSGELAGTTGKSKQVEAIQIMLTGAPAGYHVEYRAHVQDEGWQDWVRDSQVAGTTGKSRRIEAVEIRIVKN